jgi:gliding motility-associated-like protein
MIYRILIFLFFLTLSVVVNAQFLSENGFFSVPDDKACAPYVPVVTVTTPLLCIGGGCTFFPDENDPTTGRTLESGQPIIDFAYQPGTYRMKVVMGNNPATQIIDFFTITIYDAVAPEFNFYICSANRIQLEITDSKYPDYSIDYDSDNSPDASSPPGLVIPPFQYPLPQSGVPQTISVRGNYPNCLTMQKVVTPGNFAPATPTINELEVLNTNELALDLITTDNYYYELEMSTNSPASMGLKQKVANEKTLTLGGLNPESDYYCFRLGVADICTSPVLAYGNLICSADLNLDVQNDLMDLNWSTSNSGVNSFSLLKTPGTPIAIAPSIFTYLDSDIGCGTQYTYQLINEYSGGIRSISRAYSGIAVSTKTPAAIANVTSVVSGNSVELTWLQDPAFTPESYTIYRVANNVPTLAGTSTTPSYTDGSYITGEQICYQIAYKDICGKQSDKSQNICPIEMIADLANNNNVELTWNSYNGWAIGVNHYEVEKYDSEGNLIESTDTGVSTSFTDSNITTDPNQIFLYRILAISKDGTVLPLPSISNSETIIKNPNLTHPTAFVPNSQIEANQTFRVLGSYIDQYELRIFNRWGELLFESLDKDLGWDGSYNGQKMPEGTYVFVAKIIDFAGRKFEYGGTLVLLKKG